MEIIKILGMETDVERLAGTFFDESSHGSQVDRLRAEATAPGVQALEVLIARQQEMLQAEILPIQGCNRKAAARAFSAVSFVKIGFHSPQAQRSNSASVRVSSQISHIYLDASGSQAVSLSGEAQSSTDESPATSGADKLAASGGKYALRICTRRQRSR